MNIYHLPVQGEQRLETCAAGWFWFISRSSSSPGITHHQSQQQQQRMMRRRCLDGAPTPVSKTCSRRATRARRLERAVAAAAPTSAGRPSTLCCSCVSTRPLQPATSLTIDSTSCRSEIVTGFWGRRTAEIRETTSSANARRTGVFEASVNELSLTSLPQRLDPCVDLIMDSIRCKLWTSRLDWIGSVTMDPYQTVPSRHRKHDTVSLFR